MEKEVALVTGASRGIGRAIALALADTGRHVIINFRSGGKEAGEVLDDIRRRGGSGEIKRFDVTDPAACEEAVTECLGRLGKIDILVSNAGVRNDMLMAWMTPDDWRRVIDTNLNGFYNVARPVVKDMLLKRKGRIVAVASTSGQTGLPGQTNYAASKAGLIGACKALALEVAKRGVTVNVVAPGFIETDILEGMDRKEILSRIPLGRLGRPEEVAAAVVFLCSEGAAYVLSLIH
ncbi:MAG: 3-oxoacyl-ACP reductase FabG, partial [Planctomycetota bacterium]|nr:3-oxoacyl-ACP reductase FabG [Planctomycetota bacterium]